MYPRHYISCIACNKSASHAAHIALDTWHSMQLPRQPNSPVDSLVAIQTADPLLFHLDLFGASLSYWAENLLLV